MSYLASSFHRACMLTIPLLGRDNQDPWTSLLSDLHFSNFSLIQLGNWTSSLCARNFSLATLNFSSTSPAPHTAVVVGPDADAILSLLGGSLPNSQVDTISNLIRITLSASSMHSVPPSHRPDPSLLVDFVTAGEKGSFVAAAPNYQPTSSSRVVPIVAHSLLDARVLLSPGSILILSVQLDDAELHNFAPLCAPFQHIVCYGGESRSSNDEAVGHLRSTFPLALSIVHFSNLVTAIPPPPLPSIPLTWLLLHRELLLRSDQCILSWNEVTALARRCDITDSDAMLSALAHSPSFVLHRQCVVPHPSRLLDIFRRTFLSSADLRPLSTIRRRSAIPLLRQSLMTGTDIVHIARSFLDSTCTDDIIRTLLITFSFALPLDNLNNIFVVRTLSHPPTNLAVHARLLCLPGEFAMVDARCDGRLHFQRNGRRFSAWTNDFEILHVHSDEAAEEEVALVRALLMCAARRTD